MRYTFTGNTLEVNGKDINFLYSIRDIQAMDDKLIVLFNIPQNDGTVDNLCAVNEKAEVVWCVQHLYEVYPKENKLPYEQMVIMDGEIRAMDFYERCYFINPNNGKISRRIIYR